MRHWVLNKANQVSRQSSGTASPRYWTKAEIGNKEWQNQSTDSTAESIVSEYRMGKWSWKELKQFHLTPNFLFFKQTVQTLIRRRVLRRQIWVGTVS